jgi:ribonuclease HII
MKRVKCDLFVDCLTMNYEELKAKVGPNYVLCCKCTNLSNCLCTRLVKDLSPVPRLKRGRLIRTRENKPDGIGNKAWPTKWRKDDIGTLYIDECAKGVLATSMYICGICITGELQGIAVHDSKLLKEHERKIQCEKLQSSPNVVFHLARMTPEIIDEHGISEAWQMGCREILTEVRKKTFVNNIIVDGNVEINNIDVPCLAVPKADQLYEGVSSASVVCKHNHTEYIKSIASDYPEFTEVFLTSHGYGTKPHMELIKAGKYTKLHRRTFNPLRTLLAGKIVTKRQKTGYVDKVNLFE